MSNIIFSSIPIEEIKPGMKVSYSQTITDSDIKAFAGISGDHNPVHVNEDYAASSRFSKRIAHGLISASFFSALFGMRLPGPGCVYVSQNLQFKRPVYLGDTVIAEVEVKSVNLEKRRVFFETTCKVGKRNVITGDAEIYIPAPSDK
jgi:3-hydroxybutyryl-CoA dehydratase